MQKTFKALVVDIIRQSANAAVISAAKDGDMSVPTSVLGRTVRITKAQASEFFGLTERDAVLREVEEAMSIVEPQWCTSTEVAYYKGFADCAARVTALKGQPEETNERPRAGRTGGIIADRTGRWPAAAPTRAQLPRAERVALDEGDSE